MFRDSLEDWSSAHDHIRGNDLNLGVRVGESL